jgi:hypothetical protein
VIGSVESQFLELQLFCKFSAKCQIPNFLQSVPDVPGQLTHSLQASGLGPFHMSVWIRLACWSGGLSLRRHHLDDVVKSPWLCFYQVFYVISGTSSTCGRIHDWFCWCQVFYVISGTSSTCGRIHNWFPNCHKGFSLLFFWSVGDLLFVFPPSLQHGPWILTLCMTGNCFWVTVRSRIWLFVKICWVSTQNEVLKHTCNNAWHICSFSY